MASSSTPESSQKSEEHVSTGTKPRTFASSDFANEIALPNLLVTLKKKRLQSVKILIINASGKNKDNKLNYEDRRKQKISQVVSENSPHVVLFQEFKPKPEWISPENYVYKRHHRDASIMYVENSVVVIPVTDSLSGIAKEHFPDERFDPMERMKLVQVIAQTEPPLDFTCISWHGWRNAFKDDYTDRQVEIFKCFMGFLLSLKDMHKRPLLIGGDFNIAMSAIEPYVELPFKLCRYEASPRRKRNGVIDYFIVSEELDLNKVSYIDLEKDNPTPLLDHDPVVAELTRSPNETDTLVEYGEVLPRWKSDYSSALCQGLWKQRLEFTDTKVTVGAETFDCHRVVLAAVSPYFKQKLSGEQRIVQLPGKSDIIESILKFIYGGEVVVNSENVHDVYKAAALLQIKCLTDRCKSFMTQHVDIEDCVATWKFASTYNCYNLAKKAWTYVWSTRNIDDILAIVKDNCPTTRYGKIVCEEVFAWINCDKNKRYHYTDKLFEHLQLQYLDIKYLQALELNPLVKDNKKCKDAIKYAITEIQLVRDVSMFNVVDIETNT